MPTVRWELRRNIQRWFFRTLERFERSRWMDTLGIAVLASVLLFLLKKRRNQLSPESRRALAHFCFTPSPHYTFTLNPVGLEVQLCKQFGYGSPYANLFDLVYEKCAHWLKFLAYFRMAWQFCADRSREWFTMEGWSTSLDGWIGSSAPASAGGTDRDLAWTQLAQILGI